MSRKKHRYWTKVREEEREKQNLISICVVDLKPGMLAMSHVPKDQMPALFVRGHRKEKVRHATKSISRGWSPDADFLFEMVFVLANGKLHTSIVMATEKIWIVASVRD